MKTLRKVLVYRWAFALGVLAGLFPLTVPALAQDSDDNPATGGQGYGYFRLVDGPATITPAGGDQSAAAEVNQPVLAGDRVSVPRRAKVEIVLADQNILRLDGGSEVILERLAASPDRQDRATVLRLLSGNIQLIVAADSLGDELPRVETPNATIYPQYFGSYRLTADAGYSQVVVRSGTAQMVTDNGSWKVKADEEAVIDDRNPDHQAEVREAGAFDTLERWGRQLDDEYAAADQPASVDDNLRYAATPLGRYGAWITVGGASYWRPQVDADWRPFWQGRWIYTPSGLTWISSEPWGWVPYHYGSWDNLPGYGWVWQPGSVWSPAWVYWYWGADYTGWCPTGYYTRYYGAELGDVGFRFGLYGWAGGGWGLFDRWNFVSASYFSYREGYRQGYRDAFWDAHRDVRRYAVPVDRRTHGELGRGIITTDTKPLKPSVWKDPGGPLRVLRAKSPAELPDVTSFVARRQTLPVEVVHRVVAEKPQGRLDGTPLRPSTLGRPGRRADSGRPAVQGGSPGAPRGVNPDRVAPGRGGRPGLEADGGAPNPRVSGDRGNRGNRGTPATSGPAVSGGQPGQRSHRPSPEADGGAPRPGPQPEVRGARPPDSSPNVRGSRPPERQPAVRENPPPDRQPAVRENRPPERQPAVKENRPPDRQPAVHESRPPERQPAVRESRPPAPKPEVKEKPPERKPDNDNKDKKPPRS
jgi:hypothetical protein